MLGGTFDPIHFAHLRLAEEVKEYFSLDEVRLIPSANPPHRGTPGANPEHRFAMTKLAVRNHPGLVADRRELDRSGKSFMVDTLAELRGQFSDASILLILGTDAFLELTTWHQWRDLFTFAHIVVASRPTNPLSKLASQLPTELLEEYQNRKSEDIDALDKKTFGHIFGYNFTSLEVSGTALRERVVSGKSLKYLLPDDVLDYIGKNKLYKGDQL